MKNKTKYIIFALICAILICASLVLLFPIQHKAVYEEGEADPEAVYKLVFDLKAGNTEGAEREALGLPFSGAAMKLLHRIITNIRQGRTSASDKNIVSAIVNSESAENTIAEIEKIAKNQNKTIAEINEKEENLAKKAFMRILDNGIKLKPLPDTPNKNIICLGGGNMYAELDKWEMFILHLSYECKVGDRRLTREECEEKAVRFILRNMPRRYSATRPVCTYICENEGCDCFVVSLRDKRTWVKVRCDTGTVTLFCGYGMEISVYNN